MYDTLIISGGGSSGILTLGKLCHLIYTKTLDLDNIKNYGGTSIGAVICILLILNYTPTNIINKIKKSKFLQDIDKYNPLSFMSGNGFISHKILSEELKNWIPTDLTFEDCPKNFVCCSFNLCENKLIYFSKISHPKMRIIDAVTMSCIIPYVFNPYTFEGNVYIDGGIVDNCPIKKTCELFECKKLLILEIEKRNKLLEENDEKKSWKLQDFIPIIFSASNYFANEQHSFLKQNEIESKTIKISSNTPFYNLKLNEKEVDKLFLLGFLIQD